MDRAEAEFFLLGLIGLTRERGPGYPQFVGASSHLSDWSLVSYQSH